MVEFENRQPVTAAKFITKSSLFILLLKVIRLLEIMLNSEQKLRIYLSPRHIAKPPVGCCTGATAILKIKKRLYPWLFSKPLSKFPDPEKKGIAVLLLKKLISFLCDHRCHAVYGYRWTANTIAWKNCTNRVSLKLSPWLKPYKPNVWADYLYLKISLLCIRKIRK